MKRPSVLALIPMFAAILVFFAAVQGPALSAAQTADATPVVSHGVYGNPVAALASPSPEPVMEVKAELGWQSTGLALRSEQVFNVAYLDGTWTVDYRSVPVVGPEGYSGEWDENLGRSCTVDTSFPYARLLSQIGDGPLFSVGRGDEFEATRDGVLHLRINDGDVCLGDNAGAVRVRVSTGEVTLTSVTTTDALNRPQTVFRPGELLGLKIDARNTAGSPADVLLSWRVYDPYGRLLPALGLENYATQAPPGDAWWSIAVVLPPGAAWGEYAFTGTLTSGSRTTSASTSFTVGERRLPVFLPIVAGK